MTDVTEPWVYFSTANSDGSRLGNLGRYAGEYFWSYSWSPDGQYIVFSRGNDSETVEIFIASADGKRLSRLTNNSHYDGDPTWQPRIP